MIKRVLTLIVAAIILSAPSCFAIEKGEKSVGLRGGYTTSNHSGVAGLYFQYAFSSKFRLAPDVSYAFRNSGTDAYSINLNAHVPFAFSDSRFAFYPIAGLNYTSWNIRGNKDMDENNDSKSRIDRLGFNFGGGLEYYAKPTMKLAFEAKYRALKDYGSGVFTVSIGYIF